MSEPTMSGEVLPGELIEELARSAFVLTPNRRDARGVYVFTRLAAANQLYLRIQWLSGDSWSAGLRWRPMHESGRMPFTPVPLRLDRLAPSTDEHTIELSREDLLERLPQLLEEAILPLLDTQGLGP